jgi:hypothetical protein
MLRHDHLLINMPMDGVMFWSRLDVLFVFCLFTSHHIACSVG